MNIANYRLHNQQIAQHTFKTPSQVVAWLGAVQAQDFPGVKWSMGLRLPTATDDSIEQAIADRTVVRTWLMRGTLHFAAAEDVRWIRALLAPRNIAGTTARVKQLELNDAIFARSKKLFTEALEGGRQLTRAEMYEVMERGGIPTDRQRGYHLLWRNASEGLLCFASHHEKQPAFALLEEWIAPTPDIERDEALGRLALRYFTGHGPATIQDFSWWSGLTMADVNIGLHLAGNTLIRETVGKKTYILSSTTPTPTTDKPSVYLLPGFDEYLLGYKDRSDVLDAEYANLIVPGSNGMFMPTIVVNGRVEGIWKRSFLKNRVAVKTFPFTSLSKAAKEGVQEAALQYSQYMGLASVSVDA